MIELHIVADCKKGCKGRCDAENTYVDEIATMIALLEKYKNHLQNNFDKLADFSMDTGMLEFKEKEKEK